MDFYETDIPGAYIVELEKIGDERGFFARTWCRDEFAEQGIMASFVQANTAFSRKCGTLRGLHYQAPPHAEGKLVRCIQGTVYDVPTRQRLERGLVRNYPMKTDASSISQRGVLMDILP